MILAISRSRYLRSIRNSYARTLIQRTAHSVSMLRTMWISSFRTRRPVAEAAQHLTSHSAERSQPRWTAMGSWSAYRVGKGSFHTPCIRNSSPIGQIRAAVSSRTALTALHRSLKRVAGPTLTVMAPLIRHSMGSGPKRSLRSARPSDQHARRP